MFIPLLYGTKTDIIAVSVSISVNRFTNTGYHNICLPWLFMHNWDSTNTVSSFTHG